MSSDQQPEQLYRYEDILRAIGRYIDDNNIQDVVLLQSPEGILLRGYQPSTQRVNRGVNELVQHLFTAADLQQIDEDARKNRGKGSWLFR